MRNVTRVEVKKNICRVVVRKSETKRLFSRCRHGWDDNNKMDLKHVEWGRRLDWSGSAQHRHQLRAVLNRIRRLPL